jgi:hypothetical protein
VLPRPVEGGPTAGGCFSFSLWVRLQSNKLEDVGLKLDHRQRLILFLTVVRSVGHREAAPRASLSKVIAPNALDFDAEFEARSGANLCESCSELDLTAHTHLAHDGLELRAYRSNTHTAHRRDRFSGPAAAHLNCNVSLGRGK